ncbi:MAG: RNA polymerase sigma factor [Anaerolineales bacterium]|nr:RNA polymerase sigma factor [Anaerolineales bacterium]
MNHNRDCQQQEDFWIQQAKAGDTAAFENLVEKFSPVIFRTVSRMVPDKSEAEAIVQDAWLRAWRALPGYTTDRPFLPWILRIAVNRSRDIWKKLKPLSFSDAEIEEDSLPDEQPDAEQQMINEQALARLAQGVVQLRFEYRTVITLKYDSGLAYQDIAAAMGVPVNTVRTYLRRAKQELLVWMEAEDG